MPSTLRLSETCLLSIIRCRRKKGERKIWWIEGYLSPDNGASWFKLAEPTINNHGNPPHMIWLKDGRIALTYGHRVPPYGIRVAFSEDRGRTWSPPVMLRGDGGGWDLGYPRTVQRSDGKCVTIYYFNVRGQRERHIAWTLWDPGQASAPGDS